MADSEATLVADPAPTETSSSARPLPGSNLWGKKFLEDPVATTVATNVAMAGLGVVTGVLAARLLGPEGRGQLGAIQLWPSALATFAMLGLTEAVVYFSAKEPRQAGRYMGSAMFLALVSTVPFMLIGYWLMPHVLSAQSPQIISAARWYLWLIPLYALVGMPYHPLRNLKDMAWWNVLRTLPGLGWLGLLIWALLQARANPQYLASSYLLILGFVFVPVLLVVARRIQGPYWPRRADFAPMLRYGLPSATATLPQMLNLRLDQMLMAAFLPAQTLGLYVVAVAWSNAVHPILNAFGAVLFPRVASEPHAQKQALVFSQGVRMSVLAAIAVAVPLLAATPWVLPFVFGGGFRTAIPAALVLIVAATISGLNLILQEGLRGLGHPKVVMWSEFAGLGVTAVALWFLLQPFQLLGAALASFLGYSAICLFLITKVPQICNVSWRGLIPSRDDVIRAGSEIRARFRGHNASY